METGESFGKKEIQVLKYWTPSHLILFQEDTRVYLEQMTGLEELKRENQMLRQQNEELKRFF